MVTKRALKRRLFKFLRSFGLMAPVKRAPKKPKVLPPAG